MNEYEVMEKWGSVSCIIRAGSHEEAVHFWVEDYGARDGTYIWVGEPGTYEDEESGLMFLYREARYYKLELQ
jgi:hypothetical protein